MKELSKSSASKTREKKSEQHGWRVGHVEEEGEAPPGYLGGGHCSGVHVIMHVH